MGKVGAQAGKKNPNWRGGRTIASNGYVLIKVGIGHHLSDVRGYAYEHRVVAEKNIGRMLRDGEQVHHIDGNKQNNSPDNLQVVGSMAEHRLLHRTVKGHERRMPGEKNPKISCACGCSATFYKYDSSGRPKKYVSGHNSHVSKSANPNPVISCACGCGTTFEKYSPNGYERKFAYGHKSPTNPDRLKPGAKNKTVSCACGCGTMFKKYDKSGRPRKYVSGHNSPKKKIIQDEHVRQNGREWNEYPR